MTNSLTLKDWEALFQSTIAAGEEESKVTAQPAWTKLSRTLRRKWMPTGLKRQNAKDSHWRFQPPYGSHLTNNNHEEKKTLLVWIRNLR
jgi:hypothetical protein